jgi:hypothetical protein
MKYPIEPAAALARNPATTTPTREKIQRNQTKFRISGIAGSQTGEKTISQTRDEAQ